jgi:hypothetical protein
MMMDCCLRLVWLVVFGRSLMLSGIVSIGLWPVSMGSLVRVSSMVAWRGTLPSQMMLRWLGIALARVRLWRRNLQVDVSC